MPNSSPEHYASIKCCHQDIVLCGHFPVDGRNHLSVPLTKLLSAKLAAWTLTHITDSTHRRFNAGDCVCTVHCLRHPFVRHQGVRARDSRIRCVCLFAHESYGMQLLPYTHTADLRTTTCRHTRSHPVYFFDDEDIAKPAVDACSCVLIVQFVLIFFLCRFHLPAFNL